MNQGVKWCGQALRGQIDGLTMPPREEGRPTGYPRLDTKVGEMIPVTTDKKPTTA